MSDTNAWVMALDGQEPAHFSTTFGNRPRMARLVRRFVSDFHDEIVLGPRSPRPTSEQASQLSMAAHELVENAVRHGPEGEARFSITIEPDAEDPANCYTVRMKTRNRADPRDHTVVQQLLADLEQAEDPLTVYLGLMEETVKRSEGSGLGLARIRVEAQMEVTCVIDGDELEIIAQTQIERARGGDG